MNDEQNPNRERPRVDVELRRGTVVRHPGSSRLTYAQETGSFEAQPGHKERQLAEDTAPAYSPDGGSTKSRTARASRTEKSTAREILSWILSIGLAVIAAFAIRAFLFEIILVDGESMEPTLHTSERIGVEKVSRYTSLPDRGDIIIVQYPNLDAPCVKRTIGLPGETIEVRDSTVYIDGLPLQEDYVSDPPYADMAPVVVPEDSVFVMGDNRAYSMDSRASYVGPIPSDQIIGHGLFVLWPFDGARAIDHADFS